MDYEHLILTRLLDVYERSAYCGGTPKTNRRVQITFGGKDLPEYDTHDPDCLARVKSAVLTLEQNGWLKYSWRKGYENFLLDRAWLDLDRIGQAYAFCARTPKHEHAAALQAVLLRYQGSFLLPWKNRFVEDQLRFLQKHLKASRLLPADPPETEALLKVLQYCDAHSAMERVVSVNCFQDSKYLEHVLKPKLLAVIRQYEPTAAMYRKSERNLTDVQLLSLIGIQKAAEILEFCGDLRFLLHGQWVPTDAFHRGFCLSGSHVEQIEQIDLSGIGRILFVENHTNYCQLAEQERPAGELMFYHGGFYSPVKRTFLQKLVTAALPHTRFDFWADIDLGGFAMYHRLKNDLVPSLRPFRMDPETYLRHQSTGFARSDPYLQKVAAFAARPENELFADVARLILQYRVTIEQEGIL